MTEALVAAESEAAALDIPSHLRPRSRFSATGLGITRGAVLGAVGVSLALVLEAPVFSASSQRARSKRHTASCPRRGGARCSSRI